LRSVGWYQRGKELEVENMNMEEERWIIDASELIKILREEIKTYETHGRKTIKERATLMLVISIIKDMEKQEGGESR
jgi:hypothetical protein